MFASELLLWQTRTLSWSAFPCLLIPFGTDNLKLAG